MLFIKFDIEKINYEKSVEGLMSIFVKQCAEKDKGNMLERMVNKLGDRTTPVALKLLRYFDDATKDAILINLISDHQDRLSASLNKYLESVLPGNIIHIGGLAAGLNDGRELTLWASQVEVNYKELLESELVEANVDRFAQKLAEKVGVGKGLFGRAAKYALKAGAKISPDDLEKQGVQLLSSETIKAKLLPILAKALQERGLAVEAMSVSFETTLETDVSASGLNNPPGWAGLEDPIMDALAAWLTDSATTIGNQ